MLIGCNSLIFGGCYVGCRQIVTRVCQGAKECTKCEIVCCNTEKVWKVQKTIDNGYWLLMIIKFGCINKVFCILLGFYCPDIGFSIYLWCRRLMFIVGTASVTLVDGAKQAGLVSCSGSYWLKLCPVVIFFKVEILGDHLYIYVRLWWHFVLL